MLATLTKTDSRIQREVMDELKWDSRVDETEVGVQVKDGVVTLVGTVDAYAKKEAAQEAAHRESKHLDITVNDGIVHLAGTVRTWAEKQAVLGAAGFAPGVRGVDDRITIERYA